MRALLGRLLRNLAPRGGPTTRRGDSEESPPPPCPSTSTSTTASNSAKTSKPASTRACIPALRLRRDSRRRRPSHKPQDCGQSSAQAIYAAYAAKSEAATSRHFLPTEPDLARRHFVLTHQLGSGGQGAVFAATTKPDAPPALPASVAIKMMNPSLGPVDAISREINAHRQAAGHSSVPAFFGTFKYFDRVYVVSELLRGGDLRDSQTAWSGGMPHRTALRIALQLARALAHLHGRGVAHCDLKPENVLLSAPFSAVGINDVKIVDFGFAVTFDPCDSGGPRVNVPVATPEYAAPEVHLGETHDPARSDVYSLGIMLYEMLSGMRPVWADGPNFSRGKWSEIGEETKDLVRAMLRENWEERPAAAELAEALQRCLQEPG